MKKFIPKVVIPVGAIILLGIAFLVFIFTGRFNFIKNIKVNKTSNSSSTIIPISMAADNNYVYPTLVSMTSVLENAGENTKYEFYLMVPSEFSEENKNIIKSLEIKYKKCSINIIDMGNSFKGAKSDSRITTPTYYRLNLSTLLPNVDKIIWIDGDTITFKDLTDMINIDMENYYYKGFLDCNINGTSPFGLDSDRYICAGVMLINLKALREENMQEKFSKFIDGNNYRLIQHDQTVINVMCCNKIGILPPKFGMWNFSSVESAKKYNKNLKASSRYNEDDFIRDYNNPSILHYAVGTKPWSNDSTAFKNEWWDYAKKTNYYNDISNKYSK